MLNWYSHQVLLSYTEHADLGWSCNRTAALEHKHTWLPISLSEMAQASAHLPIIIMSYQQHWSIGVVPSDISQPNNKISNMAPLNRAFVPHCMQLYPFFLTPFDGSQDSLQLGIDRRCLVPLKERGAMPLFDKNRQFSPPVMSRFHLLHRLKIDSEIAHSACELLARKGLLVIISEAEKIVGEIKQREVPLYRVDINAIGRLSREDFADLQMHHAMELAICQHSSLFHTERYAS